jgi:hypothetical protein
MVMESSLTSLHIKPKLSFLSIFERLKRVYLEGLEISGQSKIDRKNVFKYSFHTRSTTDITIIIPTFIITGHYIALP